MSPLDRPIWNALGSRQAHLGQTGPLARRFDPEIGPTAAARDGSDEALAALAALLPPGDNLLLVETTPALAPPGLRAEAAGEVVQMVCPRLAPPRPISVAIEPLTGDDAPEMLALATLTQPGPFRRRTQVMGQFWGVKQDGRLLAMAGERWKLDGHSEVSAVCTHPDARGRGYAAALTHHVASLIVERGETPFLHSWAGNAGAIRVYESLGFRARRTLVVTSLTRA